MIYSWAGGQEAVIAGVIDSLAWWSSQLMLDCSVYHHSIYADDLQQCLRNLPTLCLIFHGPPHSSIYLNATDFHSEMDRCFVDSDRCRWEILRRDRSLEVKFYADCII